MTKMPLPNWEAPSNWQFFNPVRLTVGRGCRADLLPHVRGKALLIVTTPRGRRQWQADDVLAGLERQSHIHWMDGVSENPALADLQQQIDALQHLHFDAVIGFGGGSALDAAKVLNLSLNPACRAHHLEQLLATPSLHAHINATPLFALPTTAGTGSEVTPFATVWDQRLKRKLSLAGPAVFPTAAFVDAALTDGLPLAGTLSTGLDAINQAAESVWNKNANPISLAYATRALQLGFAALPRWVNEQAGAQERDQMAEASVLAGLAISHTRTALCHSISYPLTAHFGVPHGLACAFTMPAVLQHNLAAEDGRFADLAQQLLGSPDTRQLLAHFQWLNQLLNVRERVRAFIPDLAALLALKSQMLTPGRADNNLAAIEEVEPLLRNAWDAP